MNGIFFGKKLTSFQIIIAGFIGVIAIGTLLLMLPISAAGRRWTPFSDALFTSVSAVCVTGLVVVDTATYWSGFGQAVILVLIQVGGLGVITVAAFIATVSGRKITLLERSMLQDTISAHHIGGIVKMTGFIFWTALFTEVCGVIALLPGFCSSFGISGIWMSVFHSVSAFCNAGFDVMGAKTGTFSSLVFFGGRPEVVIPVCLLIITGGIGFMTWDDIAVHRFRLKKYRMQSKVILFMTAVLILIPFLLFFFFDFSDLPLKERICSSLFMAVTPRTAGFNTVEMSLFGGVGRAVVIMLMLTGGSPGSTAGGMKTTTVAVLFSNAKSVIYRKKNPEMFGRRIDDGTVKSAATLLMMYLFFTFTGATVISLVEDISFGSCLFETASAIGTVGLSLGITPSLGTLSRIVLMLLMFFGRVGGLTLMFAAVNSRATEIAQCPVEKINVG